MGLVDLSRAVPAQCAALGESEEDERVGVDPDISPLPLRGGSFTLMVAPLAELGRPDFFRRLAAKIQQAPSFFGGAPVVLDLTGTSGGDIDHFRDLATGLRAAHLVPLGVTNGDDDQHRAAARAGLAVFPGWRREAPARERASERPQAAAEEPAPRTSLVVDRPVRSGQHIYARGSDLIVLGAVSDGAELLADGHIHVYGTLRGRALAGVGGDEEVRIFCRRMEAQLVSIAGVYRVAEDMAAQAVGRPAQIYLRGDALLIDTME